MSFSRWMGIALVAVSGLTGCRHLTLEQSQRVVSSTPYRLEPRWVPDADHVELDALAVPGGIQIRLEDDLFCEVEEGKDITTEQTIVRRPDWEYTGPKLGAAAVLIAAGAWAFVKSEEESSKSTSPDSWAGSEEALLGALAFYAAAPFLVTGTIDVLSSGSRSSKQSERRPTRIQRVPCPNQGPSRVAIRFSDGGILQGKLVENGKFFVAIADSVWSRYSGIVSVDVYVREHVIKHIEIARASQ